MDKTHITPDDLLSTAEAAEAMGVTEQRIRQLCAAAQFPNAFKVGRGWIIPRQDIEALLARRSRSKYGRLSD
jgi:excisionase family DNA binding protein